MLKGHKSLYVVEITPVVNLAIKRIEKTKIQRSAVAKRERVQDGGLLSLAPPVHPPNLLVMKKRENRGGDPSLRETRKRSSNQKNKNSSSDIEEAEGPVPLSRFFECVKS